jgi:hypothetical protein
MLAWMQELKMVLDGCSYTAAGMPSLNSVTEIRVSLQESIDCCCHCCHQKAPTDRPVRVTIHR